MYRGLKKPTRGLKKPTRGLKKPTRGLKKPTRGLKKPTRSEKTNSRSEKTNWHVLFYGGFCAKKYFPNIWSFRFFFVPLPMLQTYGLTYLSNRGQTDSNDIFRT